jgi:hypothetical protein
MRYSREDDILLAKYFFDKPEGTSDKVFQAFGRMVSPWQSSSVIRVLIKITVSTSSVEGVAGASPDTQGKN